MWWLRTKVHLGVNCLFQLVNSVGITFNKRVQLVEALNVNEKLQIQIQIHVYCALFSSSEEYLFFLRRVSIAPPKNIFCFPSSWEYLLQPLFLQRICITLFLWHQGDLKCSSYKIDKWQTMYYLNRFIRIFSS